MKKICIFTILLSSIVFSGCVAKQGDNKTAVKSEAVLVTQMAPSSSNEKQVGDVADFTASFEIYTNGTKRIFTEEKYHNQSLDVYINNANPHIVHVKKNAVTWKDFFSTLPMSLTKECLVTGTKQTFCSSETHTLRFFLNGEESPDALGLIIRPGDVLSVQYRK